MMNRIRVYGLLVLILIGITATVYGLPISGRDLTYYDDDTFSNVVGARWIGCVGGWDFWGVRTAYVDVFTWPCEITGPDEQCTRYICLGEDEYGNPTDCEVVLGGCL